MAMAGATGRLLLMAAAAALVLAAAAQSHSQPTSEADALRKLFDMLRGPDGGPLAQLIQWVKQPGPPCVAGGDDTPRWFGVRRCSGGRVVVLQLEALGLSGPAPDLSLLAPLVRLRSLSLARNSLTGAFPDVSALPALKFLFMSRNGLAGEIPDGAFAALGGLQKLDLSGNAFSGPIPSSIATSAKLADVNLANNNFSGPVPDGLRRLGANLHVQGNKFLCGIPGGPACPSSSPASSSSSHPGNMKVQEKTNRCIE